MNIRFYKGFSKRKNSTKQPGVGVTYADHNCVLKNPTTIENPTIVLSGHPETKTTSGNPITITDAGAGSAQSLTVDMLPIQDTSGGEPSPTNICPISGRTQTEIKRYGKNLANVSDRVDGKFIVSTAQIGQSVTFYNSNASYTIRNIAYLLKDVTYTISFKKNGTPVSANARAGVICDSNGLVLENGFNTWINSADHTTITPTKSGYLWATIDNNSTDIQIEVGSTATTYEPYVTPVDTTIQFGQTVYGGTCDVVNGGTSDEWGYIASYNGETLSGEWLSDRDEYVSGTTPTIGAEVVYKKTPTTINTPATTISLNKGNNTLSTSGDNMSLTYLTPGTQLDYDYAYIDVFKRYYFLRQTTILSNNHIQYELEEDSLASKKTAIGATVAHIAYAATGWDKWLIDSRLPVKTTKNINTQVAASGLSNTGMYVVAIINDRSATKLGACTFYMMTEGNMNDLAYNLSDQGIITDLRNIFNNPLDSIVKAVWIPLAPTDVPQTHYDNAEIVYAGSRALNLTGHECYGAPLKDFVVELPAVSLLIPDKHQDFRDASPFTTGSLYLPGLGLTDLNMSDFIESVNVNIKTYIDITTGDITYRIYEDGGHILKTCIFNGATEIPLAHVTNNAGGTLASIGGVAGGAITAAIAGASGNLPVAFGGIATALASGTSAVMQSAMRATSIKGGIAGRSAFYDVVFKLLIVQLDTEDPDDANYIATFGRPVGVTRAINNHSGYVQCDNASVVMSGSVLERDRINDYLNTGFFYE